MFIIFFAIFRHTAIETIKNKKFWLLVIAWGFFILVVAESFAFRFSMWIFPAEYVFGTAPFGYPLLEEFLFVILSSLGNVCAWKYINKSS
jgi:hypothetical protein